MGQRIGAFLKWLAIYTMVIGFFKALLEGRVMPDEVRPMIDFAWETVTVVWFPVTELAQLAGEALQSAQGE